MTNSQRNRLIDIAAVEQGASLPGKRREKKVQRTRRIIAEVAIELFVDKGFASTTIDEIVDAADYSTSTFFRLFKDKEEVVFYDFDERLDELKDAFASPHHGNAWSLIRTVFVNFAKQLDEAGEIMQHRAALFHREPQLKSRYMAKNHQWEEVIAGLVAEELCDEPDAALTSNLIAGAAVSAFRVAWDYQQSNQKMPLCDCVKKSFNKLETLGHFFASGELNPG